MSRERFQVVAARKPIRRSYALAGALISSLLGYDLGVVGAALDSVQHYFHLSDLELSFLVGIFALAEVCSAPVGSVVADVYGRRAVLLVSTIVASVGAVCMAVATTYHGLLAGRVIAGLGVGVGGAQAPVYLAEIAPMETRGFLVGQVETFFNVGIFLGFVAGLVFSDLPQPQDFRVMFGVGGALAIIVVGATWTLPESPRWLMSLGRNEEAFAILKDISGEAEAIRAIDEFQAENKAMASWRDIFQVETLHSLLISTLLTIVMSTSGIDSVTYYSGRILRRSGMADATLRRWVMVIMGFVKTCMIYVASLNIDKVGRVWMMSVSFGSMAVAMCMFLIPATELHMCELGVAGVVGFAGAFALGVGPCYYLLGAEIWPTRVRSVGSAYTHGLRGLGAGMNTMCFLAAARRFSFPMVFGANAASCLMGILLVRTLMPETMGRSLEEIVVTRRNSISIPGRRTSLSLTTSMATGYVWGDPGAENVKAVPFPESPFSSPRSPSLQRTGTESEPVG